MSKKLLTRLLSFILGAGLVLQPVAANAAEPAEGEEEEQIILEESVDYEEILEDAPEEAITAPELDEAVPQSYAPEEAELQANSNLPVITWWIDGNLFCYIRARGAEKYVLEANGDSWSYTYEENDGVINLYEYFCSWSTNSGTYDCRFYGVNKSWDIVTEIVEFQYTHNAPGIYIREFTATAHIQDYFNRRIQGCEIEKTSDSRLKLEFVGWTLEKRIGGSDLSNDYDKKTQIYPGTWYPEFRVYIDPSAKAKEPTLELTTRLDVTIDGLEYMLRSRKIENGMFVQYYKGPIFTFDPVKIQNLRIENNTLRWDHYNTPYEHTVWEYSVWIMDERLNYIARTTTRNNAIYNIDNYFKENNAGYGVYDVCVRGKTKDGVYETRTSWVAYNYAKPKESISTLSVSSDADEIIGYKKPVKDAVIVNDDKPQVSAGSGGWQEKIEGPQEQWETYDLGVFKTGTYRYLVTVNFDKTYEEDYALDPKLKLSVNGVNFTKIDSDDDEITFASPEITVDYPELTNVKLEEDVLSWDDLEDDELWYYRILIGKYEKVIYENSIDLKELCDFIGYYGGTYPVELAAFDKGDNAISQIYKTDYAYDGPIPAKRTLISYLSVKSFFKSVFREGNAPTNMLYSVDRPEVDLSNGWWEKYGEDGWEKYQEVGFGEGTYRYKTKISIREDFKDSYLLDPVLKLTVDNTEWTRGDVNLDVNDEVVDIEFISPEYSLPLPEKIKIPVISAVCSDLSEMVVKGAEITDPVFSDYDEDKFVFQTMWVTLEDDGYETATGEVFTPGKWYLCVSVRLKEEYAETHALLSDTTLDTPGIEWTNTTGNSDPSFGIIFSSQEYVIEDDEPEPIKPEPEEITGTWHSKWGTTYFETEEGETLTGLHIIDGELYLFSAKGTLQKSVFYEEDGKKYYFGSDGKAVKGWLDKWNADYYFNEDGIMQTGFVDIEEGTYYFNNKGHLVKNAWIEEDGKKYYAKSDGTLARNETIKKWGKKYSFDENGVLLP